MQLRLCHFLLTVTCPSRINYSHYYKIKDIEQAFIESKNHGLVEDGSDFWRSFGPMPLLEQGHLELIAQAHVQMLLNIPRDEDSTVSSGNLCQCSEYKVLLYIHKKPPLFQEHCVSSCI